MIAQGVGTLAAKRNITEQTIVTSSTRKSVTHNPPVQTNLTDLTSIGGSGRKAYSQQCVDCVHKLRRIVPHYCRGCNSQKL